jgi:putative ABC transport system permease protein
MLRHYVAVACAQLAKSPLYGLLSIGGLGLGLAACILISLFVRHEAGYDSALPDLDRLYRVHMTAMLPGRPALQTVLSPGALKEAIASDIPEVERAARLVTLDIAIKLGPTAVADQLALIDPSLFDILDLPLQRGDRARIFAEPGTVLVTEATAHKYFGTSDPIGGTLHLCCFDSHEVETRVVGVLRDVPDASHLKLGIVAHLRSGLDASLTRNLDGWMDVLPYTYVKLRPGVTATQVDARLAAVIKAHVPPLRIGDQVIDAASMFGLRLRGVRDLHLAAAGDAGAIPDMKPAGDPTTVSTLAAVAVILLIISITNFVNLATARSGRRAREIAVRKVLGASPRDIILQYLGEAIVIAIGALLCALALVELGLPWFRDVMQRSLPDPFGAGDLAILLAAAIAIGVLAGAYPALVLSRFVPSEVMKANQTSLAGGHGRLRKVLVFSQFLAAIALVACTAVIVRQAQYASSAQLGYDKRDKLVIRNLGEDRMRAAREQLAATARRLSSVTSAVLSNRVPTDGVGYNCVIDSLGGAGGPPTIIGLVNVDHGFLEAYGITPVVGRGFDRSRDDSRAHPVILNLAAVRRIGFRSAEEALGGVLRVHVTETEVADSHIIGVVPDVHFGSARFPVEPMVLSLDPSTARRLTVAFAPGAGPEIFRELQTAWSQLTSDVPFDAEFLDALVDVQGRDDRRLGIGLAGAGALALLVAFAGLYGLSSFITESRTREVAIRKVLGARDRDIVGQLLWQTTQPILVACAVALPLAYVLMSSWLERFAYHIDLGPGVFVATGAAAVLVAVATVSAQTLAAARRRPVETLRRD